MDSQGDDDDSDQNNISASNQTVSNEARTPQRVVAAPEPMPSTSSQSMAAVVQNSSVCNEIRIKEEPGVETTPMAVTESVPMQPMTTNEQIHSTENSYPSIPVTPIKIEQSATPSQNIAGPSRQATTIPKQIPANSLNVGSKLAATNPMVVVQPKRAPTQKRFIKCVSKDGKISLMELVQDQLNPKVFKMVLPKGVGTGKVNLQQQQQPQPSQAMNTVQFVKPLIQPIRIGAVLPGTSTGRMPIIRSLTGNSMNLISTHANTQVTNVSLTTINTLASMPKATQLVNKSNVVVVSKPSVSLPRLVAINSPKTTMSPINKAAQGPGQLPSGTQIIKKNNKILVLESKQPQKTQQQRQSLLKSQVSLLKPRPNVMTSMPSSVKKITVTNIPGIEHRNINVFVPNDIGVPATAKSVFKAKNTSGTTRYDFGNHLENRFMARKTFTNMTEAIAWLLKSIPLVTSYAAQDGFRESFPFVVATMAEFYSLHVAKQRSFEVISSFNR